MAENTEIEMTGAPEPEPAPQPEPELEPEPEPVVAQAAPAKPRRSVRTRTLITGAVVLGVLGGVASGYTIQALRKPTALPPLAVAQPRYPQSAVYDGTQPSALPASQDDATTVNGDLTKLLLPTPTGATTGFVDHEWMGLSQDASGCSLPVKCFTADLSARLARIAATAWTRSDGLFVEIRIYQYLPGSSGQVTTELAQERSRKNALALPEGAPAAGYEFVESGGDNTDFAVAAHGDLAVYFWVSSSSVVPDPSIIGNLITQQMARL